jgi:hypothetical protein
MNLKIYGEWMCRIHIHYLLYTTQSDGAQLTLGTDVLDLRGTRPHCLFGIHLAEISLIVGESIVQAQRRVTTIMMQSHSR